MNQTLLKGDQEIYLDVIERNISRIDTLMRAFLIYVQPVKISSKENSIHELLNEVLEITGDLIISKQIQIFRQDTNPDNKIIQKKATIKIALIHIITNAIEIMGLGEGKMWLKTELINNKLTVRIEVNGLADIWPG